VRADVNCAGTVNTPSVGAFTLASTDPAQYSGCDRLDGDLNGDGLLNGYDTDLFLEYLSGHGGASATRYYCQWDGENRLTYIGPNPQGTPADYDAKEEFTYDYLGRRIEAVVSYWDPEQTPAAWTEYSRTRFVWSGWLLLMEMQNYGTIEEPDFQAVRKYTWGLDLAGQSGQVNSLEGAGGIGGLLAVWDSNDTPGDPNDDLKYVYAYDGNGNVGQVLKWDATSASAAMKARYQYDPYGNAINPTGTYASRNPIRFSTKYWDDWFGLGYWGYRWYSAVLGRWISRDPIAESGGVDLYVYCRNRPGNRIDPDGKQDQPRAFQYGTFDIMWGEPSLGEVETGSSLLVRYTLTKGQAACCPSPRLIQMAETEAIVNWGFDDVRPPHLDDRGKGKGTPRGPDEAAWPLYPYQQTKPQKDVKYVELDDGPGIGFSPSRLEKFSQSFEGCAVCESGGCKGVILGCRKYGHFLDKGTNTMKRWGGGYGLPPQPPSDGFKDMLSKNGVEYVYRACGC
jgi:RHS repeat-associated protein